MLTYGNLTCTLKETLTEKELRQLRKLLTKYAYEELDQWERWRISTADGWVWIRIDRKRPDKAADSTWTDLTKGR